MPIYEYRCHVCGGVTEALLGKPEEADDVRCEHCGDRHLERVYLSPIARVPAAGSRRETCCGEQAGCSDPKRCCQR